MSDLRCTFTIGNTPIHVPDHKDHLVERYSWAVFQCILYGILVSIACIIAIIAIYFEYATFKIVAIALTIVWFVNVCWFGVETLMLRSRLLAIGEDHAPCKKA